MSREDLPFTEDQIEEYVARIVCVHLLPDEVQDEALNDLISHYHLAVSSGNSTSVEQDLRHASAIISWALQGKPIEVALVEHCEYFGEASMRHIVKMVHHLLTLLVDVSRLP